MKEGKLGSIILVGGIAAFAVAMVLLVLYLVQGFQIRADNQEKLCSLANGFDRVLVIATQPREDSTEEQRVLAKAFYDQAHAEIFKNLDC